MGGLFCSYYFNNSIARLRNYILNAQTDDLKTILKETRDYDLVNAEIDKEGNTPLLLAIEHRKLESFNILVDEPDIDLDKPNSYTQIRPLHLLALSKPVFNSESLKIKNFRKESFMNGTEVPKNWSIATSRVSDVTFQQSDVNLKSIDDLVLREMIRKLAKKGVDLNVASKLTRSSFKRKNSNVVTKHDSSFALANTNFNSSDLFDRFGEINPLFTAILISQNEVFIDELIKQGCDCTYQDKTTRLNALHLACSIARADFVGLILDNSTKFDLNAKSSNGFTCLHYLALAPVDDVSIAQLVISHLKQNFINNSKLNTNKNLEEYLTEFINQKNDNQQTTLMLAAAKNKTNLVKFLLDNKASIELTDSNGLKAINYAKKNLCSNLLTSYSKMSQKNFTKQLPASRNQKLNNYSASANEIRIIVTDYKSSETSKSDLNIHDVHLNMDELK